MSDALHDCPATEQRNSSIRVVEPAREGHSQSEALSGHMKHESATTACLLQLAGLAPVLLVTLCRASPADNPIRILRQVRSSDHTICMTQFDYAKGAASRVVVDERTGQVLRVQEYRGRPQSSRKEFQNAVSRIGNDPTLASVLAGGAVPEGGFIVDGPSDHPRNHRYIQIRLLSPDRFMLLRVVLVDLTARVVASVRTCFE